MATYDDSRSVAESSDEYWEFLCGPCKQDGRQIKAEAFCVDCNENLCKNCYQYHQRFRAFKDHVLRNECETPTEPTVATQSQNVCVTKCAIHPTKIIEYFCGQCDKVGCMVCTTLQHRQCKNVKHIPDMIKNLKINNNVKEITNNLDSISLELEHCKNTIDSNIRAEDKLHESATKNLMTQMNYIRKLFDNLEKQSEKMIEDIGAKNRTSLKAAATLHGKLTDRISHMKSDLTARKDDGNICELFIATKTYKTNTQEIKDKLQKLKEGSKIERYEFKPSSQAAGIQCGSLEVINSEQKKGFIFASSLNIFKGKDKKTHSISALTIVSETFIAATDYKNKAVTAINTKSRVITSVLEDVETTSLTTINESQLAVSLPTENKIQFLNLSETGILTKGNQIVVKNCCFGPFGIQYCRDKLMAACFNEVRVVDMEGNEIRTIAYNSIGQEMFRLTSYLAISPDNETVYVLDSCSDTASVTSMTVEGKVKVIYRDKDLVKPFGLSVDRAGNVYVHCERTPNIQMLSADCVKVQTLNLPSYCFAFSKTSNKVFVGGEQGIDTYITN